MIPILPCGFRIFLGFMVVAVILLMYWFYRSPPVDKSKYSSLAASTLVSAAYGTVEEIDRVDPATVEKNYGSIVKKDCCQNDASYTRVKIFLSPLDVHVQCAPISASTSNTYHAGSFYPAGWLEKSEFNERNITKFEGEDTIFVVLIAGLLARRIKILKQGMLERGDKYAMIKLGSRVDMIFPSSYTVHVRPGDYVTAGETIIATKE